MLSDFIFTSVPEGENIADYDARLRKLVTHHNFGNH